MTDFETTIIPLDDALKVLAAFGIGSDNPEFQRWRRDDGFRWVDFEDVLNESRFVLNVDWREWLQDAVDTIRDQLGALGFVVTADLGEEGEQGTLEVDGNTASVKYVPSDEDDFDNVVASVNQLIASRARYRKFASCIGSDGWVYGILPFEKWGALEASVQKTMKLLLVPD